VQCESGMQPNTRGDQCVDCAAGRAGGEGLCTVCGTGLVAESDGATQCTPCAEGKEPNDDSTACNESPCIDDDACLQAKPWGASYTCAGSTQYCDSHPVEMACCPESCGTCSEEEAPAADVSASGTAAASLWGRRVQSSSDAAFVSCQYCAAGEVVTNLHPRMTWRLCVSAAMLT
jgi:hypothetical protein